MLDDLSTYAKVDENNMISQIESLPEQLMETKELTKALGALEKPRSIMIQGMGGSGIAGDILRNWLSRRTKIPISVNKDLTLPVLNNNTMLIAISYSGNTKETLLALDEALNRTDNVVCIASGGQLLDLCSKKGLKYVKVPSGYQPRCALGYLFGSAVHVLKNPGVYDGSSELEEAAAHLKSLKVMLMPNRASPNNPAKKLALKLKDCTPIIYVYDGFYSCAKRWQTQLNENAKVLSWCGSLPEMNHNEIVGWDADDKAENFAMVFLRDKDEPEYVRKRFEAIKKRAEAKIFEVWSEGQDKISRMLHLIYIGDFVSYYLAILRGIDPMPVRIIEEMKKEG